MVAYSFKKQFEPLIKDGSKKFTLRAVGKRRHAQAGDMLQHYVGQRTKYCHKVWDDKPCVSVHETIIHFEKGHITDIEVDGQAVTDLDLFAEYDGFQDVSEMEMFWERNHNTGEYTGRSVPLVLINWGLERIAELFL